MADSSRETTYMRSKFVDHEENLEWIITGISKFTYDFPIVTFKEFKMATDCRFRWELRIELIYMDTIEIFISRKKGLDSKVIISRSILLRNSEGKTCSPIVTGPVEVGINESDAQLFFCDLTKDYPFKLPNDELTVNIHLKLPNCCVKTDKIKLETASGKSGTSRDLLQESQSKCTQPTDTVLEVGDIRLPCHKFILSIRSTFFKKMLEDGKLGSVIEFEDMDSEVCQGFMAYIYTNEIGGVSTEAVLELYNVAVQYQIDGMQDKCSLLLAESLSEKNVCDALKLADVHNDSKLKKAILTFMADHFAKL